MAELADQIDSGVIAEGAIPEVPADTGIEAPAAAPADAGSSPEKGSKKLSLRDQLKASVETVRKDEKDRTPDGKFAPKEQKEVQAAPQEPSKASGPPPGFSPESKAYYNSLPPDHPLRKDIEKREKEVSDGFKQKTDQINKYAEFEQVLAPARQAYQQAGIQSDAEAIKRLFSWESMLRNPSTRQQAFNDLARNYGINLAQSQEPSTAPDIPPALRPVVDQFGAITQQVSALQGDLQRRDEEQAAQTLQQFSKDKPHFERVKSHMGQLMMAAAQSGQNMTLDQAYEQATWSNSEIREELMKDRFEKSEAEKKSAALERSKHAAAAAISPTSRAPTARITTNGKAPGVRGSIMAAVNELRERA